jgi:hypothetical protein
MTTCPSPFAETLNIVHPRCSGPTIVYTGLKEDPKLATRKKQDAGGAETLLTTTAQMIGSALGKIAVKTGIETPPKAAPKRKKAAAKKQVSSTRKKAAPAKTKAKGRK